MKEMKKAKLIQSLTAASAGVVIVGVTLIICGIVGMSSSRANRSTFLTGNWSIDSVEHTLKIRGAEDLQTPREQLLYRALQNMNEQCRKQIDLHESQALDAHILIGTSVTALGLLLFALSRRLKEEKQNKAIEGT